MTRKCSFCVETHKTNIHRGAQKIHTPFIPAVGIGCKHRLLCKINASLPNRCRQVWNCTWTFHRPYSPLNCNSQPTSPDITGRSRSGSPGLDIPRIDLMNEMQDLLQLRLDTPPVDRSVGILRKGRIWQVFFRWIWVCGSVELCLWGCCLFITIFERQNIVLVYRVIRTLFYKNVSFTTYRMLHKNGTIFLEEII